jgi:hypothetical protein
MKHHEFEKKNQYSLRVSPPQGLSEARRGKKVSSKLFPVIDRRRGRPAGSGEGIIILK